MKLPGGPGGDPGDSGSESDDPPKIDRARLDEIFGDVLPDTTADERGTGEGRDDEWYLANRPPHHDR